MSFNYCDLQDVKRWLSGLDISDLPSTIDLLIEQQYIPWAKKQIDNYVGENFDLTTVSEFHDGTGTPTLILNHRPINFVRSAVLRFVPQVSFYDFKRWFNIYEKNQTGTKVAERGGVEPIGNAVAPYTFPLGTVGVPDDLQVASGHTATFNNTPEQYRRADLYVDCASGTLVIPPQILFLENLNVTYWNYTWIEGVANIEVVYDYGYKSLEDLPNDIRQACAQLVAAQVLATKGLFAGSGATSISLNGIPKSFGDMPYGAHIKMFIENAKQTLRAHKRITV